MGAQQAIQRPHERQPRRRTDHRFRLPPRAARGEGRHGARGVRQRGAALRPDERPDVAGHPSRLEAHLRHRAGSAAAAARCSTWPAAPATSASAGWRRRRAGAAVRHQPVDAGGRRATVRWSAAWSASCRCWSPTPSACRCRIAASTACRSRSGCATAPTRPRCCAEARRVLKPGGRFFCLEFSPRAGRRAAAAVRRVVVPRAAAARAAWWPATRTSYRYLAESIRTFPDQETLAGMMREAGLRGSACAICRRHCAIHAGGGCDGRPLREAGTVAAPHAHSSSRPSPHSHDARRASASC